MKANVLLIYESIHEDKVGECVVDACVKVVKVGVCVGDALIRVVNVGKCVGDSFVKVVSGRQMCY